jgi:beta-lactamase regulating signal transducer with metallopeptidase domain
MRAPLGVCAGRYREPRQCFLVAMAGVALRLLWLVTGLLKLRGMAQRARSNETGARVRCERARWLAGPMPGSAGPMRSGPVTFGSGRRWCCCPRFRQLTEAEQTSVALHEALHVARHDWLFTMFEEVVRGLLWFHPAVWFLLNRVQLAREQAVDQR